MKDDNAMNTRLNGSNGGNVSNAVINGCEIRRAAYDENTDSVTVLIEPNVESITVNVVVSNCKENEQ